MTTRGREEPAADPIQARGTDESEWRDWAGWDALPEFALPTMGRAVVVAAHPDDEVLGFGRSISLLAAAGTDLTVVSVTDGERSHPNSRVETPESLARIRAMETRAALAELGAADAEVIRLHAPDTEVARHEDRVASALAEVMAGVPDHHTHTTRLQLLSLSDGSGLPNCGALVRQESVRFSRHGHRRRDPAVCPSVSRRTALRCAVRQVYRSRPAPTALRHAVELPWRRLRRTGEADHSPVRSLRAADPEQ
ncbi:PIG-L deacetylase family protein [Streptomyces decoyicus]|uniref:PIG-L deacetylase family protein n=1 Tax=Streptomyces decoyicus TaxID=249567 RepID=UPI0036426572